MVVEVGFILADVFGPEWDWGILIIFSELRKYLELVSTRAVKQLSKAVQKKRKLDNDSHSNAVSWKITFLQALNICD